MLRTPGQEAIRSGDANGFCRISGGSERLCLLSHGLPGALNPANRYLDGSEEMSDVKRWFWLIPAVSTLQ